MHGQHSYNPLTESLPFADLNEVSLPSQQFDFTTEQRRPRATSPDLCARRVCHSYQGGGITMSYLTLDVDISHLAYLDREERETEMRTGHRPTFLTPAQRDFLVWWTKVGTRLMQLYGGQPSSVRASSPR
jgi:hypothetical protein